MVVAGLVTSHLPGVTGRLCVITRQRRHDFEESPFNAQGRPSKIGLFARQGLFREFVAPDLHGARYGRKQAGQNPSQGAMQDITRAGETVRLSVSRHMTGVLEKDVIAVAHESGRFHLGIIP